MRLRGAARVRAHLYAEGVSGQSTTVIDDANATRMG